MRVPAADPAAAAADLGGAMAVSRVALRRALRGDADHAAVGSGHRPCRCRRASPVLLRCGGEDRRLSQMATRTMEPRAVAVSRWKAREVGQGAAAAPAGGAARAHPPESTGGDTTDLLNIPYGSA